MKQNVFLVSYAQKWKQENDRLPSKILEKGHVLLNKLGALATTFLLDCMECINSVA